MNKIKGVNNNYEVIKMRKLFRVITGNWEGQNIEIQFEFIKKVTGMKNIHKFNKDGKYIRCYARNGRHIATLIQIDDITSITNKQYKGGTLCRQ